MSWIISTKHFLLIDRPCLLQALLNSGERLQKFFSQLNEYTNETEVKNIGWKNKEILTFLKNQVVMQKAKPLRILKSNYESLINTGSSSLKNLALHMEDKQLFVWNWK